MSLRILVLAALTAIAACYDPVHLDDVATLGGEAPGVSPGPLHRSGQPCTTCHGGKGPADFEMAIGGTVFATRGGTTPLAGATVTITDAHDDVRTLTSNEAGNFFLGKSDWAPYFPLRIAVDAEGVHRDMITTIGRDGGCATCHRDAGGPTSMPGVYLREIK